MRGHGSRMRATAGTCALLITCVPYVAQLKSHARHHPACLALIASCPARLPTGGFASSNLIAHSWICIVRVPIPCTQLCQPLLKASGDGVIVFNSSLAGGPTAMRYVRCTLSHVARCSGSMSRTELLGWLHCS